MSIYHLLASSTCTLLPLLLLAMCSKPRHPGSGACLLGGAAAGAGLTWSRRCAPRPREGLRRRTRSDGRRLPGRLGRRRAIPGNLSPFDLRRRDMLDRRMPGRWPAIRPRSRRGPHGHQTVERPSGRRRSADAPGLSSGPQTGPPGGTCAAWMGGTPEHMAPEQVLAVECVRQGADDRRGRRREGGPLLPGLVALRGTRRALLPGGRDGPPSASSVQPPRFHRTFRHHSQVPV